MPRSSGGRLVAPDDIIDRLRAAGHGVGRARARVVDGVRRRAGSFTADELAANVPDVHVATVYRTLALLEEIGAVRHVHLDHGPARYEGAANADVRHLVCEVCHRHVEVPSTIFAGVRRRLERDHDFVLDGSHFAIVGRCRRCVDADGSATRSQRD